MRKLLRNLTFTTKNLWWSIFAIVGLSVNADPSVVDVTARQRYPWNGLVDVSFSFSGDTTRDYKVTVRATDVVGGTNIVVKALTVSGSTTVANPLLLRPGEQHLIWDASLDVGAGTRIAGVKIAVSVEDQVPYPTKGLLVYWPFDGDGTDVSGNGYNLGGTSVSYGQDRFGNPKRCVYFNGRTSLTLNKSVGVNKTMSLSFWAKPQKSDYYADDIKKCLGYGSYGFEFRDFPMIIMPQANKKDGDLGVALGMGRLEIFQVSKGLLCVYYTRRGVYGDGWHHYVVTINNCGVPNVYMDGTKITPDASTSFSSSSLVIPTSLNFGGRATDSYSNTAGPGNQAYKGYVDDFMVFNRVISASEVSQLYNIGR